MKNIHRLTLMIISLILFFIVSAQTDKNNNNQTVENLKKMVNSELQANKYYLSCAEKANQEGYIQIAEEYNKIAAEENMHYVEMKKLLIKMNIEFKEKSPEFTILSTKENVKIAENLEDVAVKVYQAMINQAKADNNKDAENTFKWAMEMEEDHSEVFKNFISSNQDK